MRGVKEGHDATLFEKLEFLASEIDRATAQAMYASTRLRAARTQNNASAMLAACEDLQRVTGQVSQMVGSMSRVIKRETVNTTEKPNAGHSTNQNRKP